MSFDFAAAVAQIQKLYQIEQAMAPYVKEVVVEIEAALPQSGNGVAKLQLAQQKLSALANIIGIVEADFLKVWPLISATISILVAGFNLGSGWGEAIAGITQVANMLKPSTPAPV
jgi:hypothetical protein